ncbi:MAG TPA: PD-(D/E)XK nuclease family protein [Verrucomicrobiae bacterium]|nr:PD-(D/E)XK nuclease family protein [Verrucomicrobiae bacterium]
MIAPAITAPIARSSAGDNGRVAQDHISPTAAKLYLSCSLKFYFERVAEIKKPAAPGLHLGKAVHAALQAFHLARWRGGDDSNDAVEQAYRDAFWRLEREEGPVGFADGDRVRTATAARRAGGAGGRPGRRSGTRPQIMGTGVCHLTAHRQRNFGRETRLVRARRDAQTLPDGALVEPLVTCERRF